MKTGSNRPASKGEREVRMRGKFRKEIEKRNKEISVYRNFTQTFSVGELLTSTPTSVLIVCPWPPSNKCNAAFHSISAKKGVGSTLQTLIVRRQDANAIFPSSSSHRQACFGDTRDPRLNAFIILQMLLTQTSISDLFLHANFLTETLIFFYGKPLTAVACRNV